MILLEKLIPTRSLNQLCKIHHQVDSSLQIVYLNFQWALLYRSKNKIFYVDPWNLSPNTRVRVLEVADTLSKDSKRFIIQCIKINHPQCDGTDCALFACS